MIVNFSRLDNDLHTCGYSTSKTFPLQSTANKHEFLVQNLFINGHYIPAQDNSTFNVYDPMTKEILAKVSNASTVDVLNSINCAVQAFGRFQFYGEEDRRRLLVRIAVQMSALNDHIPMENLEDVKLAIKVYESFASYNNGISSVEGRIRSTILNQQSESQIIYSTHTAIGPSMISI